MGSELQITDFYTPSGDQKNREIAFVVLGMTATGLVAYKLAKWSELTAPDSTLTLCVCQLLAVWQATAIVVRRVNFPPNFFAAQI